MKMYFPHGHRAKLRRLCGVTNQTMVQWFKRGYMPAWAAFVAEVNMGIPADKLMEPQESQLFTQLVDLRVKKDRSFQ